MELSPIAMALPLVFAFLQIEALRSMEGRWRRVAFAPLAIIVAAFFVQFFLGGMASQFATVAPAIGLCAASAVLVALHVGHLWMGVSYQIVELDDAPTKVEDNVFSLDAYREEARA